MSNSQRPSAKAARETAKAIDRARAQSIGQIADADTATIKSRLLQSQAQGEADGRDALSNLKRLRGGKLADGDEVIIARRLHDEMQRLKQHLRARGTLLRDFCSVTGIDTSGSSKELHRLTLAPSQDPASVRLRKSADKYHSLICAISQYGNRSLNQLADDVLRGTRLHPAEHLTSMSETEKVAQALQSTVDKVDRELGLFEKFMLTAEMKARAITNGAKDFWPLWDWDYEDRNTRSAFLLRASNPRNAYWGKPDDPGSDYLRYAEDGFPVHQFNGIMQDSEFFYVPHAPIGVIEFANIPRRPQHIQDLPEYEERVRAVIATHWLARNEESGQTLLERYGTVADEWDEAAQRPVGQLSHANGVAVGSEHGWLIMYPERDHSKLAPMLYIAHEEGGPYVLPLNARNLEILREAVWVSPSECKSAFDRIKDLLGYHREDERFIEQRLRHTAPWFDHNPILKAERQKAADLAALDSFCTTLWQETASLPRPPAGDG